jgi:hypothetical protein
VELQFESVASEAQQLKSPKALASTVKNLSNASAFRSEFEMFLFRDKCYLVSTSNSAPPESI